MVEAEQHGSHLCIFEIFRWHGFLLRIILGWDHERASRQMSTVDTPQAQEHAPPAPTLSDRSNSFNSDRDVQDDNLADAGAPHAEQLQHDIMSRVVDDAPAREEGSDEAEPALNLSSAHSSPLSSHLDNAAPDILADNIAQDELSDRVAHSKPLSKKAERARKKSLSAVQPPISFHPLTEPTFDIPPPAVPSKATPIAEPPTPKSALSPASSSEQDVPNVHLICLVGFDHAIGPNIEFSYPTEFEDEGELNKILPFLALPDGAHTVRPFFADFLSTSERGELTRDSTANRGRKITRIFTSFIPHLHRQLSSESHVIDNVLLETLSTGVKK